MCIQLRASCEYFSTGKNVIRFAHEKSMRACTRTIVSWIIRIHCRKFGWEVSSSNMKFNIASIRAIRLINFIGISIQ